ncbi:cytochrome c oxidase assembly protein subunit 11 [Cohaesibacter sp. ES.047]|uniref:cytochrome c oxidase assembly protein n=1 Tax=Cohaesibacter sp. ES.047 TaxID=1798205 RepID=UPI000BB8C58D|nr:cytochrome c oxidase assembly protein [Cohaesibacter sp. ES.047]SNY92038.1 cytochrome c oxidase assembly protein subunit 11 [Cohaesibacter sp. ES.047]
MSDTKTMHNKSRKDPSSANRRLAIGLLVFVGCMVGMAYAAVPLYQLFCQVTGYGGTTQAADTAPAGLIDRKITVRFDANVSGGLNWNFKPIDRPVTMKIGQTAQIAYEVVNKGKIATSGTSTFNVTPQAAGIYFNKLECFCFTEQTVQAGEHVTMPVVFFVDPDIDLDPNLKSIDTITLSYTFFPDEKANAKAKEAAVKGTGTGREPIELRAGAQQKS